jgi:hypothetical protein
MSVLDKATFFSGEHDIVSDDVGKVEVANFSSDVDDVLIENFGWKRDAIAGVGLSLSPDNLRVQGSTFITRGDLGIKTKKMAVNTIWPRAKANIELHIEFPSASLFKFESGGLWSNYLASTQVEHKFYNKTEGRTGRALLPADDRLANTDSGFCLRMICQISSASSAAKGVIIKGVIMLYPADAETVSEAVESKFPGWPGLKIGEAFFPLGPKPTAPWRCPILPFVKPVSPFKEDDVAPSCDKLREAIGGVMRNARLHDGLKSGAEVFAKWGKIRSSPRDMLDKQPPISWPEHQEPQEEDFSGKSIVSN